MWIVKYIDKRTKKEKKISKSFDTESDASLYIDENMADMEDVWSEEELKTDVKLDINDCIGRWIHMFSPKTKEMFPYGIVKSVDGTFVAIQTKEEQEEDDYAIYRIERIKDLFSNQKILFEDGGRFVTLKEFI